MLKINGTESPPVYLDDDGHVVKSDKTWKDRVREREIVIDSRKMYGPADVAAYLDVSYDTAIRRMWKMPGVVNLGTKEKLHRRGKAILRIKFCPVVSQTCVFCEIFLSNLRIIFIELQQVFSL